MVSSHQSINESSNGQLIKNTYSYSSQRETGTSLKGGGEFAPYDFGEKRKGRHMELHVSQDFGRLKERRYRLSY